MAIAIKLKEAMEAYKRRTGEKITYQILADRTGIARGTLQIIGSRDDYNATLSTVEKMCRTLDVHLNDMLEMIDDPPESEPEQEAELEPEPIPEKTKKKAKKKKETTKKKAKTKKKKQETSKTKKKKTTKKKK